MLTPITAKNERQSSLPTRRPVARVLLADSGPASRMALKSLLITAGYAVDGAATSSEAMTLLDEGEYQLVLADLRAEAPEAGNRLLAYARQKEFLPATALVVSELIEHDKEAGTGGIRMTDDNISFLLGRVAELIGERADRRMRRMVARAS